MTNESETTNPGGPKGPCLHVPAGWLLAIHWSRLTLLLKICAAWQSGHPFYRYEIYEPLCCSRFTRDDIEVCLDELVKRNYIDEKQFEDFGYLIPTEKTRDLFGMEDCL